MTVFQHLWNVSFTIRRGPDAEMFHINGAVWSPAAEGPLGAAMEAARIFGVEPTALLGVTVDRNTANDGRNLALPDNLETIP